MSIQFKQRLIYGGIGILILCFAVYFSYSPTLKYVFLLFNIALITSALWEYYHLAEQKGFQPLVSLGLGCSIAFVIAVFISHQLQSWHFLPHLILFITLVLGFLAYFNKSINPLNNLAITLFGIAYLTIPLSFAIKINYFNFTSPFDDGRLWLAYIIAVTKVTDIGAYIIGKNYGKAKLLPHISPKKTVAGSIGGFGAAILTSLLFYGYINYLSPTPESLTITFFQSLWLGAVISILAQFGDLAESVLKRDAGVKDSSYLPGLGGLLDVVDSLVFTLPLMYFILKMRFLG